MSDPALTPERREAFKKWIGLYNRDKLARGIYLNLYDIAFDKPETHVINKNGMLHYAFFSEDWSGPVEFRGLEDKDYVIRDYVNDRVIGEIRGEATLDLEFERYLLVEAVPQ